MTRKVLTIGAQDSVAHAGATMQKAGVHQLVVRGKRRRIVGVIGAADVHGAPDSGTVADFMSRKLLIVHPETALGSAAALMRANAVGSLPVLNGARLVGIVTVSDMLDVIDQADGFLDRTAAGRIVPRRAAEVPRTAAPRRSRRSGAGGLFRNILVATDLTAGSTAAVACARQLALDERARLHLLYVIPDPIVRGWSVQDYGADRDRRLNDAHRNAVKALSAMPPRRPRRNPPIVRSVAVGAPADQILGYATRNRLDLIVIGARGREAPDDGIEASIAGRVIRLAPCPVLTVLPPRHSRRSVAA